MAVFFKFNNVCLLDHQAFFSNVYKDVQESPSGYKIKPSLFSIKRTEKIKHERKRKYSTMNLGDEAEKVRDFFNTFVFNLPALVISKLSKYDILETASVRNLAQQLFETTGFDNTGICGGNTSDTPLKCCIRGEEYLLPEFSRFLCGCVKEQCKKLAGNKYNILIADPPWWNKYIRRLKSANEKLSYSMMYNEDIAAIPVRDLLAEGCVVAVWCTNAPSNISAVKDLIFPEWGVQYITTWYWLKVTAHLQPLCDFAADGRKQPYERVVLGRVGSDAAWPTVHEELLLVSVPSALHSHKPPLIEVLSEYVSGAPKALELFARYLVPGTDSVGYEPLRWQHTALYEPAT